MKNPDLASAPPPPYQIYPEASIPPGPMQAVPIPIPQLHFDEFPPGPIQVVCPYCYATVMTEIEHQSGTCTYFWCIGLWVVTAICCCIPFLLNSCKDRAHKCPNCHKVLGMYYRQRDCC
ncbi:hypothetical protein ROZALSC1DRAFT_30760 [Rozella allomycis CSF55]|uniref:LPS-induced tumor necrosis factor alpha factor domain-containing protein n=1 Tax=Rozella allomycis (strain CSF55) TaxID=988480 RepID=A0A075AR90_ROZAC|nr:LPS-induced tumor necrosis factor alpha factor domain-containing protein [Rozella allomycis CSF55]RKP17428.1 hypothetical protein ROZALSC1DRAFT_30760 [Rozella allomycis CSF55]|eukprot:EPZ32675.1 LPS-induced tumor necrosis factor alpha factor domain-containing protein [Rozella allomycis CSF55]